MRPDFNYFLFLIRVIIFFRTFAHVFENTRKFL